MVRHKILFAAESGNKWTKKGVYNKFNNSLLKLLALFGEMYYYTVGDA